MKKQWMALLLALAISATSAAPVSNAFMAVQATAMGDENNHNSYRYEIQEDGSVMLLSWFMADEDTDGGVDVVVPAEVDGRPVTALGDSFLKGVRIHSLVLPDTLTRLLNEVFYGCEGLEEVTIPRSLTHLGVGFIACPDLKRIHVDPDNPAFVERDGVLFSKDGTTLMRYPAGREERVYTVPDGVTTLGSFAGSVWLETVVLPASVTNVGSYTFRSCPNLRSIVLPEGVTGLGYELFHSCERLESVTIPHSVRIITRLAFGDCKSLKEITIPEGVEQLETLSFSGCSSLASVTVADSVTKIASNAFENCPKLTFRGHAGSYAQAFAREQGIPFFVVDNPDAVPGDTNGDGAVDTADAVLVLQRAAKLIGDGDLNVKAADVNGDGTIDTADAVLILQKAAKLIEKFPVEG